MSEQVDVPQVLAELRAERVRQGISQRELAQRIGTVQSAISELETGRCGVTLAVLERIAAALDCRIGVARVATVSDRSSWPHNLPCCGDGDVVEGYTHATGCLRDGKVWQAGAFVQWKGTDACIDFSCVCGEAGHYDGMFAYVVRCPGCGRCFKMPSTFALVEVPHDPYAQELFAPCDRDAEVGRP